MCHCFPVTPTKKDLGWGLQLNLNPEYKERFVYNLPEKEKAYHQIEDGTVFLDFGVQ